MRRHGLSKAIVVAAVSIATAVTLVACGDGDKESDRSGGLFGYDHTTSLDPIAGRVDAGSSMDTQSISFDAADGERVPALFSRPRDAAPPYPCVVYQGGLGSTKESGASVREALAAIGIASLTIDLREQGARQARGPDGFARTLDDPERLAAWLKGNVVDIRRALDYLEDTGDCDPTRLAYVGFSQGALLGILATGADSRLRAAALMSAGGDIADLAEPGGIALQGLADDPAARRTALRKLEPFSFHRWIARIAPRPVLFVNGRHDPLVPLAKARSLQEAAGEPKETVVYDGGHDPLQSSKAVAALRQWLQRHVADRA